MTQEQLNALQEKVGADAKAAIQKELTAYEVKVKSFAKEAVDNGGFITEQAHKEYKEASDLALAKVTEIAEKQGTSLTEILAKINTADMGIKSIAEVFEESKEEMRKIFSNGQGQKTFMVNISDTGKYVMRPVDLTKTVGPNATIDGIGGGVASITQALDAVSLLRMGAGSKINSQYRNRPWIFDLCNTINASFNSAMPFVMWYDELAKDGTSATVLEGGSKPLVQYKYQLNSDTYKKEAALVGFTQEFSMDFSQLESDIMGKAQTDVINRVNAAILPSIVAAATTYNSSVAFKGGVAVDDVNDFDAIAALAAQVDNATFGGASANAAIMSTFKKYRMGIAKNLQAAYLNPPDVINPISFIGNPDMAADDLLVGDFKQYNIILRGGLIVRVGYNGTDFAENKYSVVLEQFYYNYISNIRKVAIVKGPDFSTVKTAIGS